MNNNMYMIPANAKRSMLILGVFRWVDLIIFGSGIFLTFIFLLAIPNGNIVLDIIKIVPICICSFLVLPIPYYHNVLSFIKDLYLYLVGRKVYLWKGWCIKSEYQEK